MTHAAYTLTSSISDPERGDGGFHVHDAATANWVVRRILECRRYAERAKAYAAAEVARAEREERFFRWRYGRELEAWFDRERESSNQPGPQRKSLNLPAGTLGRRTCGAKLEVLDAKSVLAWARTHCPDAIAVEEKLAKSKLNAHFERTGDLPDGVVLTEAKEVFYVK